MVLVVKTTGRTAPRASCQRRKIRINLTSVVNEENLKRWFVTSHINKSGGGGDRTGQPREEDTKNKEHLYLSSSSETLVSVRCPKDY